MAELPEGMMQRGRPANDVFKPEEQLFRRVPHEFWEDDYVNLDAIELPDMSVNREKYGPPQWVRLVSDEFVDWGVIGFKVEDIPAEIQHLGVLIVRFRPKHVPLKRNFPHSEVQAFHVQLNQPEIEKHIDKGFLEKEQIQQLETLFPDELQLRWREQLRRKCRIIIKPFEEA